MNQREEEILECLGADARAAYNGEREEWESRPECVSDWWFDYCDDCGEWHKHGYERGYSVTKGRIEVVIWNADVDGNWDVSDSYGLDDPDFDEHEKMYSPEEQERGYQSYIRHVAETGDDHLFEFAVPRDERIKERWSFRVCEVPGGGVGLMASRNGDGPWEAKADDLPSYVREYMGLDGVDGMPLISPQAFRTIDELRMAGGNDTQNWQEVVVPVGECLVTGVQQFECSIEHTISRPESIVREELQAAARRAIRGGPCAAS